MAAVDRVVLVGGSNLFDTGRIGVLGTLRLLQCVLPALAAQNLGVRYALVGHTLGPVETRLGRALMRRVVNGASLVVVREELSAAFVNDELGLNLGDRLAVSPDVAFVTEPADADRVRDLVGCHARDERVAILVPRSYHHRDDVRDSRLVGELVRLGRLALHTSMATVVLVFSQCLGPTAIEDDRIIARRVAAADPRFRLVEDDLAPAEVAQLFSMSRFVVAVRLHAVILALSVGTPVHAIEYFTNKTRGVLASFGLDEHWSEFDSFDAERALGQISQLIESARGQLVDRAASTSARVEMVGDALS